MTPVATQSCIDTKQRTTMVFQRCLLIAMQLNLALTRPHGLEHHTSRQSSTATVRRAAIFRPGEFFLHKRSPPLIGLSAWCLTTASMMRCAQLRQERQQTGMFVPTLSQRAIGDSRCGCCVFVGGFWCSTTSHSSLDARTISSCQRLCNMKRHLRALFLNASPQAATPLMLPRDHTRQTPSRRYLLSMYRCQISGHRRFRACA